MRLISKTTAIKTIYILIDICCIYFAIIASCFMRQKLINFPVSFSDFLFDPQNPFRYIVLFWIVTTIFFFNSQSLYQTRREILEGVEVWLIIKSVLLSSLTTIAAIYGLKIYVFPRTVFMNAVLGMIILLSLWRVAKR